MTVEVHLFDNKTEVKPSYEKVKTLFHRSPLNKSVEKFMGSKDTISKEHATNARLPVYKKYINQIKKVGHSSKLKEIQKKMYSSIMNSFVVGNTEPARIEKPSTHKGSRSFIFSVSKSPLSATKSASSKNFILKNKRSVRGNKHASKPSVHQNSCYSTSKIKRTTGMKTSNQPSAAKTTDSHYSFFSKNSRR